MCLLKFRSPNYRPVLLFPKYLEFLDIFKVFFSNNLHVFNVSMFVFVYIDIYHVYYMSIMGTISPLYLLLPDSNKLIPSTSEGP